MTIKDIRKNAATRLKTCIANLELKYSPPEERDRAYMRAFSAYLVYDDLGLLNKELRDLFDIATLRRIGMKATDITALTSRYAKISNHELLGISCEEIPLTAEEMAAVTLYNQFLFADRKRSNWPDHLDV